MTERPRKKRHIAAKILAALIILCAALILLGKYGLSVSRYEITSARLPESFNGFRIVQLSDLHGSVFGEGGSRLLEKVAAEAPDLIVMTGDFLDEGRTDEELPELGELCEGLTDIAPTCFVSGNHDWATGEMTLLARTLEERGVRYLRNEYQTIDRGGESIVLVGVEDPNGWAGQISPDELAREADAAWPESFIVLLGHRNYWVDEYPDLPADLILCGHEHGGIVRLPGLGGLVGNGAKQLFPDYEDGVHVSGRYSMVVSRGLGNSVPLPRFNNTPEIVCVTLKCES